jgi:hypothetical protein
MAKAAKAKKTSKTMESLVVASKVKAYVKSEGMMSSAEMVEAISCKVYCLLDAAMKRTEANRRSTVKPADL